MPDSRRRSEAGQASVEYVGLVLLAALVFGALAVAAPPAGSVGEGLAGRLAGVFGGEGVSGPAAPDPSPRELVDTYMNAPLDEFLAYRASSGRDPRLDWSTDECSAPLVGSSGASFDFAEACLRHDFGYRNYDRLGVFREARADVDLRFLADMRDHCATRRPDERERCLRWARIFYAAVANFGHLTGHG
jgi:hypothetical protein